MGPLLFLDFDGVISVNQPAYGPILSGFERLVPERVSRLDALVRRTGSRVVVSSTWRTLGVPTLLGWLRARGYHGTIDGVTTVLGPADPSTDEIELWRGREIAQYRGRSRAPWCALDDLDLRGCKHLVRVMSGGLTDADVERAVEVLGMARGSQAKGRMAA